MNQKKQAFGGGKEPEPAFPADSDLGMRDWCWTPPAGEDAASTGRRVGRLRKTRLSCGLTLSPPYLPNAYQSLGPGAFFHLHTDQVYTWVLAPGDTSYQLKKALGGGTEEGRSFWPKLVSSALHFWVWALNMWLLAEPVLLWGCPASTNNTRNVMAPSSQMRLLGVKHPGEA